MTVGTTVTFGNTGRDYFVADLAIFPKSAPTEYSGCILKLETAIRYSSAVLPLKIAAPYDFELFSTKDKFVGFGYGSVNLDPYEVSEELYGLSLPVVPMANCTDAFDIANKLTLSNYQCVGYPNEKKRMQLFDCGGPIVSQYTHIIYGISQSCSLPKIENNIKYPTLMMTLESMEIRNEILRILREL